MRRTLDLLLLQVYSLGMVMTAFDWQGRLAWRNWWQQRRPSVVAVWDRTPAGRRTRRS